MRVGVKFVRVTNVRGLFVWGRANVREHIFLGRTNVQVDIYVKDSGCFRHKLYEKILTLYRITKTYAICCVCYGKASFNIRLPKKIKFSNHSDTTSLAVS